MYSGELEVQAKRKAIAVLQRIDPTNSQKYQNILKP